MDLHADSEAEVIVLSTSDNVESIPKRPRNAKLFIKSFSFLPSLLRGSFKTSGTRGTYTRKYSETKPGRQAAERLVNNYNYYVDITGGFGGSGGEGGDQGGDGGSGQGPTVYFGQHQARESSDFRTIRRGDIKLVKEICTSPQSGVVGHQSRGACVRRIHHAEISGNPGIVTVAVYQGVGAEQEWQEGVAKYESIWHPNIMQVYGLEADNYIADVFRDFPISWDDDHPSVWIRSATGDLCLDVTQRGPRMGSRFDRWPKADVLHLENVSLDAPDSEDVIISSLSEDQYHEACSQPSIAQFQCFQVSTEHPIGPGIFQPDSQHGTCVRITEPLQILPEEPHWDYSGRAPGELLPNSWIRYDSSRTSSLKLSLTPLSLCELQQKGWLAQANCIVAKLQEVAHVEDYVCVCQVQFTLRIPYKPDIPKGYLFLCPPQDFHTSAKPHANLYQWPACPAYWSLDPSGADRLSTEDTRNLGFPAIHIETIMIGHSWDHSVYEGLRRFHEGKGFDPNSREVARQLGYPLYEVLSNRVPFPARGGIFTASLITVIQADEVPEDRARLNSLPPLVGLLLRRRGGRAREGGGTAP
ncbi:hypothetical protein MSAN_01512000 [Mycena sanguinolenta]|uniref:Uncharacterized protein n=1 Tax=Mycena sanguinolenta TaxID=230812 RepID=A0A8H6Y7G4_9AGAR|nr:hypothetical protein MSAN_01512000 [Mycena sanguinolenta]